MVPDGTPSPAAIRAWATARGLPIKGTGRIPKAIEQAYVARHGQAAPAPRATPQRPEVHIITERRGGELSTWTVKRGNVHVEYLTIDWDRVDALDEDYILELLPRVHRLPEDATFRRRAMNNLIQRLGQAYGKAPRWNKEAAFLSNLLVVPSAT